MVPQLCPPIADSVDNKVLPATSTPPPATRPQTASQVLLPRKRNLQLECVPRRFSGDALARGWSSRSLVVHCSGRMYVGHVSSKCCHNQSYPEQLLPRLLLSKASPAALWFPTTPHCRPLPATAMLPASCTAVCVSVCDPASLLPVAPSVVCMHTSVRQQQCQPTLPGILPLP